MRRAGSITPIAVAAALLLCFASGPGQAQEKKIVRISGAGALSDAVQSYSEQYMKEAGNCSITVTGTGVGLGFKRLIGGETDMVMSTRKPTAEETKLAGEKGLTLASKDIGQVELAVITNDKNSVNELTMEQLAKIFKGEITNWSQVGGPNEPIKVTIRPVPESGIGVRFQEVVLKGAPYTKEHLVMSSYNMTLVVCGKSFAIGYLPTSTSFFDKIGERGVKILSLKKSADSAPYPLASGVTRETLFPISVGFYLYWNSQTDNPCIKGFGDFAEKQTE
ncbi:MAG: substrate-binding domain-containing protein [Desulfomonile tiedjei]|nr:substrate-binding domain-containing protein [Desulfomonile tiedjei]